MGLFRWDRRPRSGVFDRPCALRPYGNCDWAAKIARELRGCYVCIFIALVILTISLAAKILVKDRVVVEHICAVQTATESSNAQFIRFKNIVVFCPSPDVGKPEFILLLVRQTGLGVIKRLSVDISDATHIQDFFGGNIGRPFDGTAAIHGTITRRQIVVRKPEIDKEGHSIRASASNISPTWNNHITNRYSIQLSRNYLDVIEANEG